MALEYDICKSARLSRDCSFDGLFFTAVKSTRVFCRPTCVAGPARAENVVFYPSFAAALDNGYRPCLRCHPQQAPDPPLAGDGIAARGLRAINENLANDLGSISQVLSVDQDAIGSAFFRRFQASPTSAMRWNRLRLALHLMRDGKLSFAEAATATGMHSEEVLRRHCTDLFGRIPRAFRPVSGNTALRGPTHISVSYRPPFDWHACVDFLRPRATPGVERINGDRYSRTIRFGNSCGYIHVSPLNAHCVNLTIDFPDKRFYPVIIERTKRLFDLDCDPRAVEHHLSQDPFLQPVVAAFPGLRLIGAWDSFELAVRAILGQQVTVAAATSLAGRLVTRYGSTVVERGRTGSPALTHTFPSADQLVNVKAQHLGIPRRRAAAIAALAQSVCAGEIDLHSAGDPAKLERQLMELPGIGTWTAKYIAMRGLSYPDAFLASDLAIRRVMSTISPSSKTIDKYAQRWRPWRSYATLYLWKKHC